MSTIIQPGKDPIQRHPGTAAQRPKCKVIVLGGPADSYKQRRAVPDTAVVNL